MESIKTALFESPAYIYLFLGLVELALAAIWYERRSRGLVMALGAPILLAAAVFALETAVVTDREHISAALYEMADQIQSNGSPSQRLEAVERSLDDAVRVDLPSRFGEMGMNKDMVLAAGRRLLANGMIKSVRLIKLKIEPDGRRAETKCTTIIQYQTDGMGVQPAGIIWVLHWMKRDADWRIIRVEEPVQGVEL